MEIQLNGKTKSLENGSLTDLLGGLELKDTPFAIIINGELVKKEQIDRTDLRPGDNVEVVSFVGGG